jgi:hypothetical protein
MKDDGAQPLLCVSDNLVGDYLDKDELIYAVFGRGEAADRAASERVEQLGGRKLIEE